MRKDLLAWQWALYARGHRDRVSLLLHGATAPLFWVGTALIAWGIVRGSSVSFSAGLILWLATLVAQGRGHERENEQPVPFEGPTDLASRFFVEQFVTFPRYVLSGGWLKAWRGRP